VIRLLVLLFALHGLPAQGEPLQARGTVEVMFTPWDDVEGALVRALRQAKETIHLQAYILTSRPLTRALIEAKARGVRVAVLADAEKLQSGDKSRIDELRVAGIPIRLETRYAAAHNKVILVDAETAQPVVITGSYNFTWSAQARNSENVLFLRNHPELARRYLGNWRRHEVDAEVMQ
jgi:phosphatidylserine/phosphatidylglycerophosphate/cardiolipin synthase-like enzyme